jgi:hypothetical protein
MRTDPGVRVISQLFKRSEELDPLLLKDCYKFHFRVWTMVAACQKHNLAR